MPFAKGDLRFQSKETKEFVMSIESLQDMFLHELKDIYDAEKRLLKALPKMAKSAESEELQTAFEDHLGETENQVERLERIFESMDKPARGKKCMAMEGLVKEGEELIKEEDAGPAKDAGLIGAAQKVEHYEIATYGTLAAWAKILGLEDAVELLEETLAEEKAADEKLTSLASEINMEADEGEDSEDEDSDEEEEDEEEVETSSRRR
jgi:ferritin-like metal-binding protein YciE